MVNGLEKTVLEMVIVDIWTDAPKLIKKPRNFGEFKKGLIDSKFKDVQRRGKIILLELDSKKTLLIHPKMTGHFLVGKWKQAKGEWKPKEKGAMEDPMNKFIHLLLYLDNGLMLAFSDLRKFGRIELWDKDSLKKAEIITKLGPDALGLFLEQFQEIIKKAKKKKIKPVLMDQKLIAGIGNIYSDEILFEAGINPFRTADSLKEKEIKKLSLSIKIILNKALRLAGASVSDFRRTNGTKGDFDKIIRVYRREGQKCPRCGAIIQRKKLAGRSTHFCSKCQTPMARA